MVLVQLLLLLECASLASCFLHSSSRSTAFLASDDPAYHSSRTVDTTTLLWATAGDSTAAVDAKATRVWTRKELIDYADRQGVIVSLTTLGPGYRALARAKHNSSQILGYVEGFIRPTGNLLHLDKMEVFRKMVQQARKENPDEFKGGGTILGVGLLLGYLCLLHGQEMGRCEEAEFLAIDDEDFQHKRLVRFYKQAGFKFIKYVGDDFQNIPDRLVWGGCGTLLRAKIPDILQFWTALMVRSERER
jgi:hypothetical protein